MTAAATYRAAGRILEVARQAPERAALVIDGETWSYAELVVAAWQIAERFGAARAGGPQPITAVMAQRHVSSYAGILAARLSGHCYVPLNVNHPAQRNATMLACSGAERVIVGTQAAEPLRAMFAAAPELAQRVEVLPVGDRRTDYAVREGAAAELEDRAAPGGQRLTDLAYILFTSGSTGNPKGVGIGNRQLESYLAAVRQMLAVRAEDRFSQTFDLTFDLSVHDLFVCWEHGATLVVPSVAELRKPADFIRGQRITQWFSVPSLAYQMRMQGDLVAGAFPLVRASLFCGEALPMHVAREWAAAAANSSVENWYGPTEATIACSRYVLANDSPEEDTVPIGRAFCGMELLVLDEQQKPCAAGVPGALYLAGQQVADGYLNDPKRTAESFVLLPEGKRAYRTGDRAVLGADGEFRFLGRFDNQVKVRGYRIELGEIEGALRKAAGGRNAVALAWPAGAAATAIVAALEAQEIDAAAIQKELRAALPEYMVPAAIFPLGTFPTNANGKVDRKAIAAALERRSQSVPAEPPPAAGEEAELLAAIQQVAPLLDAGAIRGASNLFDAGMDSLAFTGLTMELERRFGMSLDQDQVVRLAEMSFDEMVGAIRGERAPGAAPTASAKVRGVIGWLNVLRGGARTARPRANRAVQFIERFPTYLARLGAPDVLALGSSGVFRSFAPGAFERAAAELGAAVRALNAGLPGVNAGGMRMLCEFVREQCQQARARVPLVIYELDPMHVSTTPPGGDIHLGKDYFNGKVRSNEHAGAEFQWQIETAGAWNPGGAHEVRKPDWLRKRGQVVAGAYLGEIEFVERAVDEWLAGARALEAVCDRLVCFVHPADPEMIGALRGRGGSDRLENLLAQISRRLSIRVLAWEAFELEPADFLDVNHVNMQGGREKLSAQLARMLFANYAAARAA